MKDERNKLKEEKLSEGKEEQLKEKRERKMRMRRRNKKIGKDKEEKEQRSEGRGEDKSGGGSGTISIQPLTLHTPASQQPPAPPVFSALAPHLGKKSRPREKKNESAAQFFRLILSVGQKNDSSFTSI